MERALKHFPLDEVSGHFHDTYGQALANIYACLELGVHIFDASVAGLGGCPYAKGATGNVATEDVVFMLHGLGIETGIDLDALVDAGAFISGVLGRAPVSRAGKALLAKRGVAVSDGMTHDSQTAPEGFHASRAALAERGHPHAPLLARRGRAHLAGSGRRAGRGASARSPRA